MKTHKITLELDSWQFVQMFNYFTLAITVLDNEPVLGTRIINEIWHGARANPESQTGLIDMMHTLYKSLVNDVEEDLATKPISE